MIFSLLNKNKKIRKKTSAVIAGIAIGIACLWGISMWQDISPRQLLNILLSTLAFILGTMLIALVFFAIILMLKKLVRRILPTGSSDEQD